MHGYYPLKLKIKLYCLTYIENKLELVEYWYKLIHFFLLYKCIGKIYFSYKIDCYNKELFVQSMKAILIVSNIVLLYKKYYIT